MKNKKIIVSLLIMLSLLVSGFTYAYWASGVTGNSDEALGSINIGEGDAVNTTVVVGDADNFGFDLVPVGFDSDPNDESSLTLSFSVNWSGTGATGANGTLAVNILEVRTVDAITAGTHVWAFSGGLYGNMFTVSVTSGDGAIVAGTPNTVIITVTFTNQPASQAIYNQVANGKLEIDIEFDVTAPN
jgi:hypothetical protein